MVGTIPTAINFWYPMILMRKIWAELFIWITGLIRPKYEFVPCCITTAVVVIGPTANLPQFFV